jgi:transketolase
MTELGQKNENVALCADLIGSLKFDDFKTIQSVFGIAEANMIGIAAGLTIEENLTGTFANFSTGRVYDQIRQSVAT